jgi:hypothetical protein
MTLGAILGNRLLKKGVPKWYLSGGISPANAIAIYRAIGAPDLATSYVNLVNPGTYNAAPGVAPNFNTSYGWEGTGSQWLSTGVTVDSVNWSLMIRFSNWTVSTNYMSACGSGATQLGLRFQAGERNYYYGAVITKFSAGPTSGVVIIAGTKVYLNGVDEGVTMPAPAIPSSPPLYIFARNNGGPGGISSGRIQAYGLYNVVLTPAQAAALSTAAAALT